MKIGKVKNAHHTNKLFLITQRCKLLHTIQYK